MSSSYNNHHHNNNNNNSNDDNNNDTFNSYISNITSSLTSDDILTDMSQAELAELAIWKNAQFNDIDLNVTASINTRVEPPSPSSSGFIDTNFEFEDEEMLVTTTNNIIHRHDFISLTTAANQYHLFNYPAATTNSIAAVMPTISINSPIFSIPTPPSPITTIGNLIDDDNNKNKHNTMIAKKELLRSLSNINNDDVSKDVSINQNTLLTKSQNNNNNNSNNNNNTKKRNQLSSPSSTISDGNSDDDTESIKPDEAAKLAAEEDKRRRNTAASARFRVKKKLREQALEKTAKEMTTKAELLEGKIKELEMENKWLRSLIVEKDATLSTIVDKNKKHPEQNNNINNNKLKDGNMK